MHTTYCAHSNITTAEVDVVHRPTARYQPDRSEALVRDHRATRAASGFGESTRQRTSHSVTTELTASRRSSPSSPEL